MIMRNCAALAGAATLVAIVGQATSAYAQYTPLPVALTGVSGSALGPGSGVATFVMPSTSIFAWQSSISNSGIVAFRGVSSDGTSSSAGNGVWMRQAGSNSSVILGGAAEPGGSTYPTTGFNSRLSPGGSLGVNFGTGIVNGPIGGPLGRLALASDTAPGTGGATYSAFTLPPMQNSSGQSMYVGSLTLGTGSPEVTNTTGIANNSGLFIGSGGPNPNNTNVTLAFQQNQNISSILTRPSGATGTLSIGAFTQNSNTAFNDNGKFLMLASIQSTDASDLVTTGSGATSTNTNNNSVLLTNRGGALSAVYRRHDICPDVNGNPDPNGHRYGTLNTYSSINNDGRVAFYTSQILNGTGSGAAVAAGALYSDHDNNTGTIKEIARALGAVPSVYAPGDTNHTTPLDNYFSGKRFGGGFAPRMGADNSLYFNASGMSNITGATNPGTATGAILRRDTSGNLSALYIAGSVAYPGGASNGTDIKFSTLVGSTFALNERGQIAAVANLSGTGVNQTNDRVLVATDLAGSLQLLARVGDFWDFFGDGTDYRQIVGIGNILGGPEDGLGSSFNANGDLVFELSFGTFSGSGPSLVTTVTSSGVYVVSIPSPATASLLAMGGVIAGRRRRRLA